MRGHIIATLMCMGLMIYSLRVESYLAVAGWGVAIIYAISSAAIAYEE